MGVAGECPPDFITTSVSKGRWRDGMHVVYTNMYHDGGAPPLYICWRRLWKYSPAVMDSYLGGRSAETQLGMGSMSTWWSVPKNNGTEYRCTPLLLVALCMVDLNMSFVHRASWSPMLTTNVPGIGVASTHCFSELRT